MTGPPEGGGGRGPTPRPAVILRNNLSGQHATTRPSRLRSEVMPRLEAVTSTLAATVLGLADFDEVGPWLTRLADKALQEADVAAQEHATLRLRGRVA